MYFNEPATHPASSMRKNSNAATKSPREKQPQGNPRGRENEHPKRMVNQAMTHANRQSTMNAICVCGNSCKNLQGLKIHQTKMGCVIKVQPEQRSKNSLNVMQKELGQETPQCAQNLHTPDNLGETQENPSPESTHSAQNLHALEAQAEI